MSKIGTNLRDLKESSLVNRRKIYAFYFNKYYNLFMNSYKWEGIDYQQTDYIMRKLWSDGTIAAFKIKGINEIGFTTWAPFGWNIYDYPIEVTLINPRGVAFIPKTTQKVDEDVVLGWAQRNKKSVQAIVDIFCEKITDVEMTIRTNLKAHKTPWLVGVSPEDKDKIRTLFNNLEKDDAQLYVDLDDSTGFKSLVSGAPYIIDKLYAYKCALENELKEYLGITNLGNQEKKEHLITSEVEANSEITESSGDCFFDVITEFTERVKDVLGFDIRISLNKPEQYYEEDEYIAPEEKEVEADVQI